MMKLNAVKKKTNELNRPVNADLICKLFGPRGLTAVFEPRVALEELLNLGVSLNFSN